MSQLWEKIRIGSKISDHFMIMRALEPAGGGPVFSAMDVRTKRLFQVRFFSEENIPDQRELERRIAEARNLNETCGAIVTLPVEHGFHEGLPYVIHDFAKLKTLDEMLRSGKVLADNEVKHLMDQLFKLLIKVHAEGSLHLGLSPLAIHQRGGEFVTTEPGIIDFCLAPRSGPSYFSYPSTGNAKLAAIAGYTSPEQAGLSKTVDHRADLYSMGALIYRFATGMDPFQGNTAEQVLYKVISQQPSAIAQEGAKLPEEIYEFLSRALEKNPDRRFQDAGEMMESFIGTIPGRIVRTSLVPAPRVSLDDEGAVKFVPPPAPSVPSLPEKVEAAAPSDSRPGRRPEKPQVIEKKPKAPEPPSLPASPQKPSAAPKKPMAPPLPVKPEKTEPKKTSKPPPPPAPAARAGGAGAEAGAILKKRQEVKPVVFPFKVQKPAAVKTTPEKTEKKIQSDLLEREISVQVESGVDFHIDIDELMEEEGAAEKPVEKKDRTETAKPKAEDLLSEDVLKRDPHHMATIPAVQRKPEEVEKIIKSASTEVSQKVREKKETVEKSDASRWIWIALGIIFVGIVCAIGYFKLLKNKPASDSSAEAAGTGGTTATQEEETGEEEGEATEEASGEKPAEEPGEEVETEAETPVPSEGQTAEETGPAGETEAEAPVEGEGQAKPKEQKKKKQKTKKKPPEEESTGMRFID